MYQLEISKQSMLKLQRQHGSDANIAKDLGYSRQTISALRRELNIPSGISKIRKRNERIFNWYNNKKYSVSEIHTKTKLSITHIYRILKQYNNLEDS